MRLTIKIQRIKISRNKSFFLFLFFLSINLQAQIFLPDSISLDSGFTTLEEAYKSPNKVHSLDLSEQEVINIDISLFPNLVALSINESRFSKLPPSILQDKKIKFFSFTNNDSLKTFPTNIFNMNSLQELWLNGTPINQMEDVILLNRKLNILYMIGCNLNDLPNSFSNLIALNELYLLGNNFTEIPKPIFKLNNLEILNLSGCPIKKVNPKDFKLLKKLKKLLLFDTTLNEKEIHKIVKYLPTNCEILTKEPR